MLLLLEPVLHVYVLAPEEVSVAEFPEQMLTVDGETETVGVVLTDTVLTSELVQPLSVLVPVTV